MTKSIDFRHLAIYQIALNNGKILLSQYRRYCGCQLAGLLLSRGLERVLLANNAAKEHLLLKSIDSQTNRRSDFQKEVLWLTTNQDCLMFTSMLPCSILDGVRANYTPRKWVKSANGANEHQRNTAPLE